MRGEDKLVDGRELAIKDEKTRSEEESHARRSNERFELGFEQELTEQPARVSTQHEDQEHRTLLLGVMRAIMEGQKVVVELLQLPQRELIALEALQAATRGKDTHIDQFVYATDRRDLLEQALGVLQPTLLTGEPGEYLLGGDLAAITHHVSALRTELIGKEDAQDELLVVEPAEEKTQAAEGGEGEGEGEGEDDEDGEDEDEDEDGDDEDGEDEDEDGDEDDEDDDEDGEDEDAGKDGNGHEQEDAGEDEQEGGNVDRRSTLGHEDVEKPVKPVKPLKPGKSEKPLKPGKPGKPGKRG